MPKDPSSQPYYKNIHFTRLIKSAGRLKEFNFRRRNAVQGNYYDVDTSDERGNRFIFTMQPDGSFWKISGRLLPDWIVALESEIEKVILEQESIDPSKR